MERAIKLLGESKLAGQCISEERLAIAAWERAVGKKIAAYTKPVSLVRSHLVVNVDDDVWRQQLYPMRHQIVDRLARVLGRPVVATLEFKVGTKRRAPGRETYPVRNADTADEASSIPDPILSRLYRASRTSAKSRAAAAQAQMELSTPSGQALFPSLRRETA